MTTINKQALVTQINTTIAGINTGTASTQEVSLWRKVATNAGGNDTSLTSELRTRVGTVTGSTSVEDLLMLGVSLKQITADRVLTVTNLAALYALTNVSAGSIYYVQSEGVPYIRRTDNTWVLIDPSLQPAPNAWAWGLNGQGQLGNNTTVTRSSPVSVMGGFTDWTQVSAGEVHTLALRANGSAWAWGSNGTPGFSNGFLGDNTTVSKSSPVGVVGGFSDWTQVSAGR